MTQTSPVGIEAGYTLIELLVVMTILLLVVSIVPAAYSRLVPSAELQSTARKIMSDIRSVRMSALRVGDVGEVWFDELDHRYSNDSGRSWVELPDGMLLDFSSERKVSPPQYETLFFFSEGGSSGGLIKLSNDTSAQSINVDWLTGKTELQYAN